MNNNSIFSIDDFSDPFWESSSPPLDSDSAKAVTAEEWTVEMFLEEIASSVSSEPVGNNHKNNAIVGVSSAQSLPSVSGQNDLEEDSRFRVIKNKLETIKAGSVKPEDSISSPETLFQPAQSSLLTQGSLVTPGEVGVTSSLLAEVKKTGVSMKQVTSGSSRDYSDDDDLDEETETTGSLKPEDVKKSRRMLSNRESARRSRRRKQEQTCDLETQVNELKGEHSSLLKQLSNMNHKYDDAAVGNRILKADIETLRAKVKMAEETVKRVTGMNPMLLGRSNGHNNNNRMPLTGNSRMASSCIPPFQPNLNHLHNNPNMGAPTIPSPRLENRFVPTPSLNSQTNSHLQRIRTTQNHHVAPTTNTYGWTTETHNDSAW